MSWGTTELGVAAREAPAAGDRHAEFWPAAAFAPQAGDPAECLLAIFDALGEWQRWTGPGERRVPHARLRAEVERLAAAAGVPDAAALASQWALLMAGAIIAAAEGDPHAARRARAAGALLLEGAPAR